MFKFFKQTLDGYYWIFLQQWLQQSLQTVTLLSGFDTLNLVVFQHLSGPLKQGWDVVNELKGTYSILSLHAGLYYNYFIIKIFISSGRYFAVFCCH